MPLMTAEPNLTSATRVQVSLATRSVLVDDEVIVLDVLHDRSFRLNSTATRIWSLLQDPQSIEDLSKQMATDLNLKGKALKEVIIEHVRELHRLGLADVAD